MVSTDPMPKARAASIRFCTEGSTELACPGTRDTANTTTGASFMASANRMGAKCRSPGGAPSGLQSAGCLAHHASLYSSPNLRTRSRSRTTRNRAFCSLRELGALDAASINSLRSSSLTGSGLSLRMALWVNMASPRLMASLSGGSNLTVLMVPAPFPLA